MTFHYDIHYAASNFQVIRVSNEAEINPVMILSQVSRQPSRADGVANFMENSTKWVGRRSAEELLDR